MEPLFSSCLYVQVHSGQGRWRRGHTCLMIVSHTVSNFCCILSLPPAQKIFLDTSEFAATAEVPWLFTHTSVAYPKFGFQTSKAKNMYMIHVDACNQTSGYQRQALRTQQVLDMTALGWSDIVDKSDSYLSKETSVQESSTCMEGD